MISEVVMPQMGADMVEGTIVRWLKNEGDPVERGEIIAEIETDKANVEIEAFESGVFRKAVAAEGDVIPVGGLIGIIAAANEDISKYETPATASVGEQPAAPTATTTPPSPVKTADARVGAPLAAPSGPPSSRATTAAAPPPAATNGRLRISPVARRMAEERGLDLNTIHGTGPDGRIIKRDIESALTAGATAGTPQRAPTPSPTSDDRRPTTITPSRMRQTIARRMSQSKREAPHYYLLLDIDMTAALETRQQYNTALASGDIALVGARGGVPEPPADTKVSINDMLVRAAALALRKHPEFNATIDGDTVSQHPRQNICIGIALEEGLIAPAILDAADKTLAQIAAESKDLSSRAKGGSMRPAEINDGTFTITNLGAYGVETLIGIIQPPQTAILGVGTVTPQPAVRDGQVAVRQMMKVALSADHRVTDGAQGAQFLAELKRLLESPLALVL
ncbi:MAG: 2-oxo acid dehydrogenase subunit E2 [Chloroflexi bacterium]|nr:2-oxo acid dehydrogenase subunit E2 [Chloroflexota bacterium]